MKKHTFKSSSSNESTIIRQRKDGYLDAEALCISNSVHPQGIHDYSSDVYSSMALDKYPLKVTTSSEGREEFWAHPVVALNMANWLGDDNLCAAITKWTGVSLGSSSKKYIEYADVALVLTNWHSNTSYMSSRDLTKGLTNTSHKQVLRYIETAIDKLVNDYREFSLSPFVTNKRRNKIARKNGFEKAVISGKKKKIQYLLNKKALTFLLDR